MELILFFKYYINIIIALFLFYSIGAIVFNILKINSRYDIEDTFFKTIIGLIILIFLVATIKTKGKTIMIFLIIPVCLLLNGLKSNSIQQNKELILKKNIFSQIGLMLLSALLILSVFFFKYNKTPYYVLPHIDYIQYSKLSAFIWNTTIENFNIDYINTKTAGVAPYHYFEIWLNAILAKIFNQAELSQLIFGTYPLGIILVYMGILVIASRILNPKFIVNLSLLLLLFISGIYLSLYDKVEFLKASSTFCLYIFSNTKVFTIYLFIIFIIIGFLKDNNNKIILSGVLFLSICYSTTLPIIYATTFIFYSLIYLFNEKNNKYIYINLILIINTILIYTFYHFLSDKNISQLSVLDTNIFDTKYIRTLINIIVGGIIQTAVVFLPLLIINATGLRTLFKQYNKLVLFSLLLLTISVLFWAVLHKMDNSVQLYSNIILPLIISIVITFYLTILKDGIPLQKYIYTLVLLIIIIFNFSRIIIGKKENNYQTNYVKNTIESIIDKNTNGVFLYSKQNYNSYFKKISNYYTPGLHLAYLSSKYQPISLSIFDIPLDKNNVLYDAEKNLVETSIFYRYILTQKQNNKFVNIEQSQIDFIKEYNIQYLITTKDVVLNNLLSTLVDKKLVDSKSGERFYILKHTQ